MNIDIASLLNDPQLSYAAKGAYIAALQNAPEILRSTQTDFVQWMVEHSKDGRDRCRTIAKELTDAHLLRGKSGYIYLAGRWRKDGKVLVKIGASTCPEKRVIQVSRNINHHLTVLNMWKTPSMGDIEELIHTAMSAFSQGGEWFEETLDTQVKISHFMAGGVE